MSGVRMSDEDERCLSYIVPLLTGLVNAARHICFKLPSVISNLLIAVITIMVSIQQLDCRAAHLGS